MKIIFFFFLLFAGVQTSFAQVSDAPKKEMTKAEKDAIKAKKEADQAAAFKELALTDTQIAQIKEVQKSATEKSNALKTDQTKTDAEKEAAKKLISDEKNQLIKNIMGEEIYRQYNAIKKRQQKEMEAATNKSN